MRNYKKENFSKGQTVFIYVVGNAARYCKPGIENRIQEWEVKTVGSKYITAVNKKCSFREAKFSIENDFRQVYERGTDDYILFHDRIHLPYNSWTRRFIAETNSYSTFTKSSAHSKSH